jgi:hypothetical protein
MAVPLRRIGHNDAESKLGCRRTLAHLGALAYEEDRLEALTSDFLGRGWGIIQEAIHLPGSIECPITEHMAQFTGGIPQELGIFNIVL